MKDKFNIWVEGIADQKFLADVLQKWYDMPFNHRFEYLNDEMHDVVGRIRTGQGVSSFTTEKGWQDIQAFFTENEAKGIKNLIVIDADDDVEARKSQVAQNIKSLVFNHQTDLFLWPDNTSKGDLETLLELIINPEHKLIFECWKAYEECLKQSSANYTTPAQKTKIYAYLEALLGDTKNEKEKIKERERDYTNADHWNLDPQHPSLNPLHTFLNKHLKP